MGHTYSFLRQDRDNLISPDDADDSYAHNQSLEVRKEPDSQDLVDILHPQISLPHAETRRTEDWLVDIFHNHRGFELGTFNASILATAAKKQSSKWKEISMGYVSDVVVMVHRFIVSALTSICTDRDIRDALINKLSDDLIKRYEKAFDNTEFLLEIESGTTPMTLNHYFNDNLQKR